MLTRIYRFGSTRLFAAAIALAAIGACAEGPGPSNGVIGQTDAGTGTPDAGSGGTPTADLINGVYGDPLPGLGVDDLQLFGEARKAFEKEENVASGLGPVFNDTFCAECHDSPPAIGGTNDHLETRFGFRSPDGGFDPLTSFGGTLLHDLGIGAVPGYVYVGEVVPSGANVVASRRTQPVFGLGLVEATPDAVFGELAASQAVVAPEAAGRPAMVIDLSTGQPAVGRFGWKAAIPSLLQFAGDAALNEMGITSPQFPNEVCPQGDCPALAFNPDPAINDPDGQDVALFADYMRLLGPPPAPQLDGGLARGSELFESVGCAVCHVPTLVTGPNTNTALDRVAYHPYSDFLLHDMGTLGDGIDQGDARGSEMRTQPLWGLSQQSRLLHDGRTEVISDAIAGHDGQGAAARDRFAALSETDRTALLAFLGAL